MGKGSSSAERGSGVRTWKLGTSIEGRSLEAVALRPGSIAGPRPAIPEVPAIAAWKWILLLGAVHGDEPQGLWLLEEALAHWTKVFPFENVGAVVWPCVNPDGVAHARRCNGRHIDLNRNLPTADWTPEIKNPRYLPGEHSNSEPENKALVNLIEAVKPVAILSLHAYRDFQINSNGPAREWSERLSTVCGYRVTEDIGYPTPGCLGHYAGIERKIPTITFEVDEALPKDKVLSTHLPVLQAALAYWDEKGGQK